EIALELKISSLGLAVFFLVRFAVDFLLVVVVPPLLFSRLVLLFGVSFSPRLLLLCRRVLAFLGRVLSAGSLVCCGWMSRSLTDAVRCSSSWQFASVLLLLMVAVKSCPCSGGFFGLMWCFLVAFYGCLVCRVAICFRCCCFRIAAVLAALEVSSFGR
ncbi:hypothetical protein U1Q18_046484, partial [Sarracenia purpurea var. burkii]